MARAQKRDRSLVNSVGQNTPAMPATESGSIFEGARATNRGNARIFAVSCGDGCLSEASPARSVVRAEKLSASGTLGRPGSPLQLS